MSDQHIPELSAFLEADNEAFREVLRSPNMTSPGG